MSFLNSKKNVSAEEQSRHRQILTALTREPGNKTCVDCGTTNPTWYAPGMFMCLTCSGIHRSLGVHISQVRSCNLDTWLPKQVEFVKNMGNVKANKYWEARLPPGFRRPSSGSPSIELGNFIREKYVDRRYAATDVPPTIDNYQTHPYGGGSTPASQQQRSLTSAAGGTSLGHTHANGKGHVPKLEGPGHHRSASATVMGDLLGGFDDVPQQQQPRQPAPSAHLPSPQHNFDPFDALVSSFQTCPPHSLSAESSAVAHCNTSSSQANTGSNNRHLSSPRLSNDWTDFASAPAPQPSAATPQHSSPSLLDTGGGWGMGDPFAVCAGPSMSRGIGVSASPHGSQQGEAASLLGDGESKAMPSTSTYTQHHASAKSADEILSLFDAPPSGPPFLSHTMGGPSASGSGNQSHHMRNASMPQQWQGSVSSGSTPVGLSNGARNPVSPSHHQGGFQKHPGSHWFGQHGHGASKDLQGAMTGLQLRL
ncbi:hypothetical protein DUNSADRAFT_11959 [Dunaliella salina]|uniref:Arf-GAP domain-containing protein n=1 Tax=Dunaliella salina TaxID=3046 RepID=A0ABQ7GC89_DUNSA|nr:hypothetical protein DUNSADRAFT_11959 [Dunaliella salina]|eukprot:KAF5832230.1 hypothetical protein DUNSADRAFT_11959 [Dunaliella salina]